MTRRDRFRENRRYEKSVSRGGFFVPGLSLLLSLSSVSAATPTSALPDFSSLTPFTTFGNFYNYNLVTINGDVGFSADGKLLAPNGQINGTAFLDNGVTKTIGGPSHFTGGFAQPTDLSAQQALVFSGSNVLKNLAADYSLGNVTTGQTINAVGSGMVTVVDLNNLTLGGSNNLTLNGGTNDFFVVNVAGKLAMTGSSEITGSGGIDASHILINLYDNSGNMGTAAHIGNIINGTVLIPFDAVTFHSMNGAIWSGNGEITLMSGATLTNIPFVPEPSTTAMLLFGGLVSAAAASRKRAPFWSR